MMQDYLTPYMQDEEDICDRILENHPYGCKWQNKYVFNP